MAKINGNEIRPGMVIEYQDTLWVAVKTMAVKPGKGPAYNQVELKNLIDGRKLNNRFGSDERVERVRLEQKDFQFLYKQGEALVFMDNENYEQLELQEEFVGERAAFLQDGMTVTLEMHDERPISIKLPDYVTLAIVEADPVEAVKWHLISKAAGGTTDLFLDDFARKQPPKVREDAEKAAKPWLTAIAASKS
jgi:elongation factor P